MAGCEPVPAKDETVDLDGDGFASMSSGGADCDDEDASVNPDAPERCDEIDNDCDGSSDEDDAQDAGTWYADQDEDGFGDGASSTSACSPPEGYLAAAGDCDDGDAATYPGAEELCGDGVVNDCDGDAPTAMAACGLGGTLSLSDSSVELTGEYEGDGAGGSVSTAGDVDGDGLADLLVGAPGQDAGDVWAGAAYLLLGGGVLDGASGALGLSDADLKLTGEVLFDEAGAAVCGAGDVDGDDLDDILVGAYAEDTGGAYAGAAYLLLGGGALEGASGTLGLSGADLKLTGEVGFDTAGKSISTAGDVDGDGLDDILVGAPYEDTAGTNAGAAYLLLGGGALESASGLLDLSGADLKLTGESMTDSAGTAISAAGDLDADGLSDILVGAVCESTEAACAGAVYLLRGADALSGAVGVLSLSEADLKLTGEEENDGVYGSAGVGDVDGDGLADLLVGAPGQDAGELGAGAGYLLLSGGVLEGASGALGLASADLKLTGEVPGDSAGLSVSGAGDVDGDHLADILIGAQGQDAGDSNTGAVYLLLGGGALEGASGTEDLSVADLKLAGEAADDQAGESVSRAGDVNGDDLADLLVGANGHDASGADAGAAYLLYGGGY